MGWFDNFPEKLRIGPYDIKVKLVIDLKNESQEIWGAYMPNDFTLVFNTIQPNCHHATVVVLHEIGHAVYSVYECYPKDSEERLISVLSMGWAQVYRDNPTLLEWITGMVA